MVQVQRYRHIDIQIFQQAVHHTHYCVIAAHVLARAFGYAQDNGRLAFFGGQQDGLCPLQVVDVELAYRIMTCLCFFKHFCC